MERDTTIRKAKMCKFLVCGCRRVCSCKHIKSTVEHDGRSKHYPPPIADCWSPNSCRPWISSWFNPVESAQEHADITRCEIRSTCNENQDDKVDLYHRAPIFPTQSRRQLPHDTTNIPNTPILPPSYSIVGHPSLKIYKFRLPHHLLHLLDEIVAGCRDHAANLPTGWMTYLYSLTKQDIALRDVPSMYEASRPIIHYIKHQMERIYEVKTVRIDRNQPHVLKYSAEDGSKHTGVELHHDKCDLTANIMLSRSSDYVGGGTYFPDANATVRLEFGEFLIHPGNLVHGGADISRGTRYLMVMFTHC